MHPVETYLSHLAQVHSTGAGVPEASHYFALEFLLNEVGKGLKPVVRCVSQLANKGAGSPDFGLFTANQLQRLKGDQTPLPNIPPERGVVEVKAWCDDSLLTAKGAQVSKYSGKYGTVLVTNYRDFVLVCRNDSQQPEVLETFQMADGEAAFREMLMHPRKAAAEQGPRLMDFLQRVLLHDAPLATPEDLAWFLASYAREARARIDDSPDLPALQGLKKGLEDALGMTFQGEEGEHFFRATLVQTLFYGVFSAWVLWAREHPSSTQQFDWHLAGWTLHVPMIKTLYEQVATPSKLKPLGIDEVLNWTGIALNRVDRKAFFERFEEEHAVQYFYEPFLKAYDPELRKELGVWYTPPEIVRYQVERVDRVLREELDLPDGLADDNVVVLDPCCGTGAYLVEVLRRIHDTLDEKGGDALTHQRLKAAALKRIFGFEILPAPFVIAHLQMGLFLRKKGTPLNDSTNERARVYLTNALTGWEPPKDPKTQLTIFPEMAEERDAANDVKQKSEIIVILGNPPYNGFAGMAVQEERDLSTAYRTTKRAPAPQGQGLNDLYVRFFRMAERRIVEKTGKGVICFISNYSWLEGLSHTGMRERYLDVFDRIWIDCLNGDKYKTGKLTPWGESDPSIFSTDSNREGIQVGTAISLFLRRKTKEQKEMRCKSLKFRHLWGKDKHAAILRNAKGLEEAKYEALEPSVELGFPISPVRLDSGYLTWPLISQLFLASFSGVQTKRDDFVVGFDKEELLHRLKLYFSDQTSDEEISKLFPRVMQATARFQPKIVRQFLVKRGFLPQYLVRYMYRPFDSRWVYWEPDTKLLGEKSPDYFPHVFDGNVTLFTTGRTRKPIAEAPLVTHLLCDLNCMDSGVRGFPLFLKKMGNDLLNKDESHHYENITDTAKDYLAHLECQPNELFYSCLSIGHSSLYREHNLDGIRQDWPRTPLPRAKEALLASAELGRHVAALLDTEKPVDGVTSGKIRPELRPIGVIRRVGGGELDPAQGHLDLTAGWGHGGKDGVCMPGKGRIEKRRMKDEGGRMKDAEDPFGEETYDIYLNETAYWENVPPTVWDYHIGGYQVIKKWLSYREKPLLGRGLKLEEAAYVTEMTRRIAALILMQPELDANYQAVKSDTYNWPGSANSNNPK